MGNASTAPAVGTAERHSIVRLTGQSSAGGTPDVVASRFLTEAGFATERGQNSDLAYLGARPIGNNLFLDLTMTPGKRKEGSFVLVRTQTDGAEVPFESGEFDDLDRTATVMIISGRGGHLFRTQIVVSLHPIDKGQAVATLGQSAPQIVLMPDPAPSAAVRFEVELPLGQIEPWPEQPRKQFKDRPLAELAESMATLVQVQPILVRPFQEGEARTHGTSKYQIVDGERRWRSACLLKATAIKAIVVHPRDALEQHRMSVIANMHQEPHSHYELALAVIFQYDHGRSALEITADFSKKSPTWAYSYLRLKALVPELFELLNPEVPEGKQISFGQARILAEVKKEMQVRIWAQANQEGKAHGQRGILLRLQELAAENLSEESQFGRERKRKSNDRITRPVSRAIAAVLYNARMLVESAARFKNSLVMQEPADRAKVAGQVRGAAEQLLEFSRQIVG